MPTVKIPAKGKGKAPAKAATKAATKPAAASNGSNRRTAAEVDAMVPAFVKHLKDGGTMRALKQEHGFTSDVPIREALARKGFDSRGGKLELPTVAATPKGVAAARKAGHSWHTISLATGKTIPEVKELGEKGGAPAGRVYVGGGQGR